MRLLRLYSLTLLLAVFAVPASARGQAGQPASVAVVVRVTGAVQVQPGGNARPVAAAAGTQLRAGSRVVVPAGGRAVVLYRTGRTETLTRTTTIAAPSGRQRNGVFRQTMRTLNEVASTDARTQPNRQGMIRPLAGAAVPIEPRNETLLLARRPTFVWFSLPEAEGYVVQVREIASGRIARYAVGRDTSWTLADSVAALAPGGAYEWSVASTGGGRAAPPQRFRLATAAQADSVNGRLEALRRAGLDPEEDGLFLAALVYRDAGLYYDARAVLDWMCASGQGKGREFHLLRGEVYDRLGMLDQAAAEFAAAESGG